MIVIGRHKRVALLGCLVGVWALPLFGYDTGLFNAKALAATGGPINGYVGAILSFDEPGAQRSVINLPDIEVFAKNINTGAASHPVATNPQGFFRTPLLPPGEYQICVSGPGYISSCDPERVSVTNSVQVVDHTVPIRPAPRAIFGTVSLADKKTPCFWFRPAFDVNATISAAVILIDSGGNVVAGPVRGNSLGQYVLPTSSAPGGFEIRAICEHGEGIAIVQLGPGPLRQNITIQNNAPQIVSLELAKGKVGVRRADPGDVLRATVTAADPDGDHLHYRWVDNSGRNLSLPDAPSVDWPLINGRALNILHVQVSDGKGGFAVDRRSLPSGPDEILFSGTVFNRRTDAPVGQVQVSLNEVYAQTDNVGHFQIVAPDAPRFVLNLHKTGFALTSRIYYGRNTGLKIPLDPAATVPVDATRGGLVTLPDERCVKTCEKCEKSCSSKAGLSLSFEPGSLVEADGRPYKGIATLEGFQYDLSQPNPIPGDQGATYQGKTVRMATFGAFYLQPRNTLGQPLKMAPGAGVKVSMPIEPGLRAKAPPIIPFFSYDKSPGIWKEHATLTRAIDQYTGAITHFSEFNADTVFTGSACLKVILDKDSFTLPVFLDAFYVDQDTGLFYHNGTAASDSVVGIERMPPNVSFILNIYEDPVDSHSLVASVTLNSGPPLDQNQFPDGLVTDPEFKACNGPVTIYSNNIPPAPTFLMPVSGGSIRDHSDDYKQVTQAGAGGNRQTFDQWKQQNGFPDPNDAHAIYFNNGDLKFGRDMHCRAFAGGKRACYVSNFGDPGHDDADTALHDARVSHPTPVATVAMEYDPNALNEEKVQFWAYDGGGNYLATPALDGQGGKPMPEICMACHGGIYTGQPSEKVSRAVFLPFDLDSFRYDADGDPQGVNQAAVQEQFRKLNEIVLDTDPDDSTTDINKPIAQLVNKWYPGGVHFGTFSFGTGANEIHGFVGHEPLYDDVVKRVCRTCHIARGVFAAGTPFSGTPDDFTKFADMNTLNPLIQAYACGSASPETHQTQNFAMPHAEVPFKFFWQKSLSSTLDSELNLGPPHCPNQ